MKKLNKNEEKKKRKRKKEPKYKKYFNGNKTLLPLVGQFFVDIKMTQFFRAYLVDNKVYTSVNGIQLL